VCGEIKEEIGLLEMVARGIDVSKTESGTISVKGEV
jgi:hypothetical protein